MAQPDSFRMQQIHLKITGYVQGVFFRAETQNEARTLGLTGWVRNNSDGGVEILAQGPLEKLQELIDWCQNGPDRASVENVGISWEKPEKTFTNFEITR